MLKELQIKNFQSHEDTSIKLSPGITAITGSSCHGKSSIVRSIKWVADNRPSGTAFKSNFSGDNGTVVKLDFDEGIVTRTRTKSSNSYTVGSSNFDVVRTDVPDEVTKLLNFSDLTIQGQHDPYFLLQDSSGEVAKKLNRVANLEIIDFVLKEVNSDALQVARDKRQNIETMTRLTVDLEKYEGLDEVKGKADALEGKINRKDKLENESKQLAELVKSITEIEEDIEDVVDWLSVEKPFEVIRKQVINKADLENSHSRLERLIEGIEELNKYILECERLMPATKAVANLLSQINIYQDNVKTKQQLGWCIKNIDDLTEIITEDEEQISLLEKEATKKMIGNKNCPLCSQPVSAKHAQKIIGGWL